MVSAALYIKHSVLLFQQASPGLGGLIMPLMLGMIFLYIFAIFPQRKQQRQLEAMRNSLEIGDTVITTGGIYGRITRMADDKGAIQMRISGNPDVKINIARNSIAGLATLPDEW